MSTAERNTSFYLIQAVLMSCSISTISNSGIETSQRSAKGVKITFTFRVIVNHTIDGFSRIHVYVNARCYSFVVGL